MPEFRLLVTLHNIVNLPKEVASGDANKSFTVVVSSGLGSLDCPDVSATFSSATDIQVNDRLEAKLEASNDWVLQQPSTDVTVTVYENIGGISVSNNRRVTAVSTPVSIDAAQIINVQKLNTRIIGTSMGQVGVSFAVSPSDTTGYTARLEEFMRAHNPQGIKLVASVVRAHGEVEAFTKIYKKYNLVDYPGRVNEYFETYGREFIPQIPTILAEWENREEELMRNLILDNGPELRDIELSKRLAGFVEKYNLKDFDIDRAVSSGQSASAVMQQLTRRYGPEPCPRDYYFPAVFYNPNSLLAGSSTYGAQPSSSSVASTPSGRPPVPQQPQPQSQPQPQRSQSPGQGSLAGSMIGNPPFNNATTNNNNNNTSGYNSVNQSLKPGVTPLQQRGSSVMAATPTGPSSSMIELWSKLCEDLRQASVPLAELHYVNDTSFDALLVELGYAPHIRAQLSAEWQRRVRAALRQEQLSAGDPMYEAARRDILTIANLHPLNVNVVGVVALKNAEHEGSFSLRLADAKVRATERMLMVGDYTKLLNSAMYGISPTPQRTSAAAVFFRNPLQVFQHATSVCVLVCDVVVGKPQVITEPTSTPYDATHDFLSHYDSCVFTDPVQGAAVAVYSPQQVLPRYIVHCNIDNSITPCPANPTKPVEYLVVENNAFACSQCVVMGQYRGKDVIPIEEASTQARTQLSEMHRDATALVKELQTEEDKCAKELDDIMRGEIRENALRAAEQIRREAEQRIQQLLQEAEEQERAQQLEVQQQKSKIHAVVVEAQQVANMLQDRATRTSTSAIEALLTLRQHPPVPPVREKAMQVLQRAVTAGSQPQVNTTGRDFSSSRAVANAFGVTSQSQPQANNTTMSSGRVGSVAPRTGSIMPSTTTTGNNAGSSSSNKGSDLFSKYMNLKNSNQPSIATSRVDDTGSRFSAAAQSVEPPKSAPSVLSAEAKANKAAMSKGWSEFRSGDRSAALQTWNGVYERNPNNGTGARAKAYIAEAIERDYEGAASWYEKALQYDPTDVMTLYNYGVLLESVMHRPRDALQLFETAFRHGDHTAGRRAQQIKASLGLN